MRAWVLLPIVLLGCDNPVDPDMGAIFQPVQPAPAVAPSPPSPATDGDAYDFEADARDEEEAGPVEAAADDEDAPYLLAEALGYEVPEPEPEPELAPAPTAWTPASPIRGEWGVTVISTTPQAQPPVAVLRFADGPDALVHPGDLLAERGIVVMAIGKDAVQIARVRAEGDHAKVVSEIVPMLSRAPNQLIVQ